MNSIPSLNPTDFQYIKTLRDNRFFTSSEVVDINTKARYIITKMRIEKNKLKNMDIVMDILQKLYEMKHFTINRVVGYIKDNSFPLIVCDLPTGGALSSLFRSDKLYGNEKFIYIYGIANAMYFLHRNGIVHSDLKAKSIYIGEDMNVKLGDFAQFQFVDHFADKDSSMKTNQWVAPELFKGENSTEKSDVFAFGSLLLYFYTRKFNYGRKITMVPFAELIVGGIRANIPEFVPLFAKNLISKCWSNNPEERPSFSQIITLLESNFLYTFVGIDEMLVMKHISRIKDETGIDNELMIYLEDDTTETLFYGISFDKMNTEVANYSRKCIQIQYLLSNMSPGDEYSTSKLIQESFFYNNSSFQEELIDFIFQSIICQYFCIESLAILSSLLINGCSTLKNLIWKHIFDVSTSDRVFPDRIPSIMYLYFLFKHNVFSKEDIVEKILQTTYDNQIPNVFKYILYCYFSPILIDGHLNDVEYIYSMMNNESANIFFPDCFRLYLDSLDILKENNWHLHRECIENGYSVNEIKRILIKDDFFALRDYLFSNSFDSSIKTVSEIFDPCIIAHDKPFLCLAAGIYRSHSCFQLLQMVGADLSVKDMKYRFLPMFIVAGGNSDLFNAIDKKTAEFDSILHIATIFHRFNVFRQLLIMYKFDLSKPDRFGQLLINISVISNNMYVFLYCLSNGVSINQSEQFGVSLIFIGLLFTGQRLKEGNQYCFTLFLSAWLILI